MIDRIQRHEGELQRFRHYLSDGLGLAFDDARGDALSSLLERRARARGVSVVEYLEALEDRGRAREELRLVAPDLTVPETYFYRHVEQLTAFADLAVLATRATEREPKRPRILCLGCASGEEPYTLAILLRNRGIDTGPGSIRAIDVNAAVLAKAARATYGEWALRETPADVRARWFTAHEREYRLDDSIRSMVTFEQRNIAAHDDPTLFLRGAYDIVFCRNMLMYFTREHARACVERITEALAPGGWLFLGHAETLRGLSTEYDLRHAHGAFFYQRKSSDDRAAAIRELPLEPTFADAQPVPSTSWIETIREASERVRVLASRSVESAEQPIAGGVPGAALGAVLELARLERFGDALDALTAAEVGSMPDAERQLLRAALLTQHGDIEAAEAACRTLLDLDGLHAGAHYLLALCREAGSDVPAAMEHDRMAAYLDPSFAMPRLHLGLAARRTGDLTTARAELGHALELLHHEDPARILLFGGGFARDSLVALCRAELQACGGRA